MNTLKVAGKFLDQPMLVTKFHNAVPAILTTGAALYTTKEILHAPEEKRKKCAVRTVTTMALTVASALAAPKITNKLFKADEIPKTLKELKIDASGLIKTLFKKFDNNAEGKKLLNNLIPDPENIDSKEIFSEIGRLSVFGLIPVLGGIAGGIVGDKLTTDKWKQKIPDKIKEGSYQYLANIFLCNIGAGGALAIMEKLNVKSKAKRAAGMVAGIIATGVIGGSAIANLIGNKIINPMFEHGHKHKHTKEHLFDERKPEPLHIGLHTDDIATVAVMSGLKWIEPALPIMYSVSGYRAGIGYRNGKNCHH